MSKILGAPLPPLTHPQVTQLPIARIRNLLIGQSTAPLPHYLLQDWPPALSWQAPAHGIDRMDNRENFCHKIQKILIFWLLPPKFLVLKTTLTPSSYPKILDVIMLPIKQMHTHNYIQS